VVAPGEGCDTGATQDCYCRGYPGAGAGGCTYNAELCDPPPSPSPSGPPIPKLENDKPASQPTTKIACGDGKKLSPEEKRIADLVGDLSMASSSRSTACSNNTLSDWDAKLVDWGIKKSLAAPPPVEDFDCLCTCSGCPPPVMN